MEQGTYEGALRLVFVLAMIIIYCPLAFYLTGAITLLLWVTVSFIGWVVFVVWLLMYT